MAEILDQIVGTRTGFDSLAATMDVLEIGFFVVDQNQRVCQSNRTAEELLGIDHEATWENRSLERIDAVLGSGMQKCFENVLASDEPYSRKGLRCTNARGHYLELDLACHALGKEQPNQVVGLVRKSRLASGDNLEELQDQVYILSQVAAALSSTQDLQRILRVILTGATASQGLGFNRAFLFLYDQSNDSLKGYMAVGPSSAEEAGNIWSNLDAVRLSLEELLDEQHSATPDRLDPVTQLIANTDLQLEPGSLLAEICGSGDWKILSPEADLDSTTSKLADCLGTRELALVPMVSKDRLRGMLVADNLFTRRPISNEAVQTLQILGKQAAVAMERARLYDAQIERSRELEHINQLLAESQDQIIRFEKLSIIGELTSAVAHELRNPLTIVGGFANLLLKSDIADDCREYLNIIAGEVRRAESVLDHVLDFKRASQDERQVIDWDRLVQRSHRMLTGRMRDCAGRMKCESAGSPIPVYGNLDQLSQAVYHLLKLVAEELVPPCTATVLTGSEGGRAHLSIRIDCDADQRRRVIKTLQQSMSDKGTTIRLAVLVAGETFKYHGGDYRLDIDEPGTPAIRVELPIYEGQDG